MTNEELVLKIKNYIIAKTMLESDSGAYSFDDFDIGLHFDIDQDKLRELKKLLCDSILKSPEVVDFTFVDECDGRIIIKINLLADYLVNYDSATKKNLVNLG